jgi:uncharacterized protein YgiM (DUF1202 family)
MKMKYGFILATMISTVVTAQVATNTPPPLAAPGGAAVPVETTPAVQAPVDASVTAATNQPAAKKAKKTAKKKDAKKAVVDNKKKPAKVVEAPAFADNESAVAKQNNINIRGQANINSEVVGHLKQGEAVTVLKEVTLKHPKTDEPAKWAQIALPAGMHVWVNGSFLDTNQTVVATKLNLRTGPGENFSVIGQLHKGDTVKALNVKGDWAEVEAPSSAYAFVAAHLLARKVPGAAPTEPVTPPVAPVATTVETTAQIAPPAAGTPATTPATTEPTASVTPVETPTIPAPLPAPVVDEPPAKRIVQREGIVGGTVSIQAPTHFELESLDDGKLMDYLYSTSTNLTLQRYKGLTVLVSGEEALDERWPNTPVITIQRIQVVK